MDEKKKAYLDAVPFAFIIDRMDNVHESVITSYGKERFLRIHSLHEKNKEQIQSILSRFETKQNKEQTIEAD